MVMALETSRQAASPTLTPQLTTLIGYSLTSFTRVVASDSGFRIAHRTMQSDGQQYHFANSLFYFTDCLTSPAHCGYYAARLLLNRRLHVRLARPVWKDNVQFGQATRMKKYRFI